MGKNRLSLILGVALLLGPSSAVRSPLITLGGTLVVMVPSNEGLVVAADSRSSVANIYCDSMYKITELNKPARTIATVTGNGIFVPNPGPGVQVTCLYLKQAPRLLDIAQIVKEYVEKVETNVANIRVEDLAKSCVESLKRFGAASPLGIQSVAGQEIFCVVIAQYDAEKKTATIRSFVVRVLPSMLDYEVIKFSQYVFDPQSARDYVAFGETDYLNQSVLGGIGFKFLNQGTLAFLHDDKKTVSETTLTEAVAIAANFVQAAAQTTAVNPAPSGIGGPIDIVLLGHSDRPQRLQWK